MKTLKNEGFGSIGSALRLVSEALRANNIPNHLKKAEWLIENITGLKRAFIYLERNKPVSPKEISVLKKYLAMAVKGIPVQYITKQAFFYGLELKIERGVFIPRPETELLVEKTLGIIGPASDSPVVFDICCGCGSVGIAVAKNSDANVFGTDISSKAVKCASLNAESVLPGGRAVFFKGDLFRPLAERKICRADIIVANPPYIAEDEIEEVDKYILKYEPRKALLAEEGGTEFYRRIMRDASFFLKNGGHLICEIGYNQAGKVSDIAGINGFSDICVIKDYNGKDRIVHIRS
ncbi:MAG: peptide chain release factor N(5)-glutamine methyltransferase [bacterium]|nr:peptide chain release factor N(5)-glutamine methyltransferase [bacterium]